MKAKLILFIILMTVIPILTSAQTKSGDDSSPTKPTGTADSLLPDPSTTNVPTGPGSIGTARRLTGVSDGDGVHYADLHRKPRRHH
jgi:hypothetical protein